MSELNQRIAAFYDAWSQEFVEAAGTTFQSGLIKGSDADPERADTSTLLCAQACGIRDGDRLLDAGCGVGGPAVALLQAYPNCVLHGVTLSPVQAELATDLARRSEVGDRATFAVADYHALPFAAAAFDAVFFFECTGYSPDPAALYREAARVLRPGGRVYVKDVFAKAGPLTSADRDKLVAFDALWQCHRTGTLAEAQRAARQAGFAVATREYPHVGTARFLGAMVGDNGQLNAFGRGFVNSFAPIVYGELIGTTPHG